MANAKIIEQKTQVVNEIKNKFEDAKSVVVFDYRSLNVGEVTELRKSLKATGADCKVYKNTLVRRAVEGTDYDLTSYLTGPNAIAFSDDELAPVKIISDFAKNHEALELKAGIVDGKIVGIDELKQYASIPSREGLLTMLAGGLIGVVRDLSICLNLYAEEKEGN